MLLYVHMTNIHLLNKHKELLQAFKSYQERYINVGKKPDITKLFSNDLYHTMRLEGEQISKKQVQAIFSS